jgi:hypothetical protein
MGSRRRRCGHRGKLNSIGGFLDDPVAKAEDKHVADCDGELKVEIERTKSLDRDEKSLLDEERGDGDNELIQKSE